MLSVGPQYYSHIYILLVAVLSLYVFVQYTHYLQYRLYKGREQSATGVILLAVFMVLFIGLRPVSGMYFVDMSSYATYYSVIEGGPFVFDWHADNKLFDNFLSLLASLSLPVEVLFVSIAAIYFGCMAYACSKLFPKDKIAAFLVYLGALSTFSYGTNGIKAGAAGSLFLVALSLYENRRWIWTVILLLLSLGFHHSMIMPIACFIVCLIIRDPRWFFAFWILSLILAAMQFSFFQDLFASLADEQGAGYLSGSGGFVRTDILGGFRIDFILYSAVPIIIGWIAVFNKKIHSRTYSFFLSLYTLINSVWLLCIYAEFTNRIAYLSWLMLPVVLIYPFLKERWGQSQYKTFHWVALGHLAFTLFMQYVYY